MKILGMRAVGEHASSAIQGVGLLIKMDSHIHELAEMVHPHPSIIEGVQECVRMLLNKSIFKSSFLKINCGVTEEKMVKSNTFNVSRPLLQYNSKDNFYS